MDFARKQLEKYGWSDGKGLGKNENGISEALKPKLKRSVAGIGHDPASEFNEHWWSALYDKAAGNVEVEEKNGKTKKIKTKDENGVVITNSTWKLNRKKKDNEDEQYTDYFIKTAVMSNDGSKMEKLKESDSEEEEAEKKDVFKMTDEELFAACGGRTAHKGARHGLKATGKLARIAQQEQMLLIQPQYNGYSHASRKKNEVVEEMNLDDEVVVSKKKKRKRCLSNEVKEDMGKSVKTNNEDESVNSMPENIDCNVTSEEINSTKNNKHKSNVSVDCDIEQSAVNVKNKKKKRKIEDGDLENVEAVEENEDCQQDVKVKKKKKKKHSE